MSGIAHPMPRRSRTRRCVCADSHSIKTYLTAGNDFREPLCRRSYGIALDEPLQLNFDRSRRKYIFNVRPWTETDISALQQEVHQ